ncbi:MAG: VOC family protein [Pseudomonadota bacterium]
MNTEANTEANTQPYAHTNADRQSPTGFYPVLGTKDVAGTADFYRTYFGFESSFDADWYVSLRMTSQPQYELAILDSDHPSVPESIQSPTKGLLLNIEVPDVDLEYERLKAAGIPIVKELQDEDWGQRHFIASDPNGVLIDVIKVIPPGTEYSNQYVN